MASPVTVRSLAAELGVAPITVSRALRGHTSVRVGLATRIRQLAKRRGYQSNSLVAEVMSGLGRRGPQPYRETIAFVWTHEQGASDAEERGAREAAERLGYRMESFKPWMQALTERDMTRILWARGIRGVLLAPNSSRPNPVYELEWKKFAPVLLGSSLVNAGIPRVARDYYHDARLALGKLQSAGFSRIGLVLDSSTHERTERRYAAAFQAFGRGPVRDFHLVDASHGWKEARRRFEGWRKKIQPDVVLGDFPRLREWLPSSVPRASLLLTSGESGPGVRADFARVGMEAMRILDGLLRENRLGLQADPVRVLVPGVWIDRPG